MSEFYVLSSDLIMSDIVRIPYITVVSKNGDDYILDIFGNGLWCRSNNNELTGLDRSGPNNEQFILYQLVMNSRTKFASYGFLIPLMMNKEYENKFD